jgi:hypothetical protein
MRHACHLQIRSVTSAEFHSVMVDGIDECVTCSPRTRSNSALRCILRSAELPRCSGERPRPCLSATAIPHSEYIFCSEQCSALEETRIKHLHQNRLSPPAWRAPISSWADQSRGSRLVATAQLALPQRRPAVSSSLFLPTVASLLGISHWGSAVPSFSPFLLSAGIISISGCGGLQCSASTVGRPGTMDMPGAVDLHSRQLLQENPCEIQQHGKHSISRR